MADARTDAEHWRELLPLWEQLAACWNGSPRGERLRAEVIAPLRIAATSLAAVWLNQSLALVAWQDIAAIEDEPSSAPPSGEWDTLLEQAEQLRRRGQDEQRATKSRLTNLLSSAKEQQTLIADLAAFLQLSSHAFAKLAALPSPAVASSPADTIRRQIEQNLTAAPPGWPPGRLAAFLARGSSDDTATRLRELIDSTAPQWRSALDNTVPDLSDDLRETVILLRSLIECSSECDPASSVWSSVAKLARDLLPAD